MSQLPRYDSYKESGIEWLGEIPSHWSVKKNKFILFFSKGLTITKENLIDKGIPCVNYGEIHSKYGFEVDSNIHQLKCVSERYIKSDRNTLLQHGDFIFADTSEDIKGSGNFTYVRSKTPIFAGYHTIVAKMKEVNDPRFLAYVFDSDTHRNQVRTFIKGVKVYSITQMILKNTFVWLPPLNEQKIIVDFLDKRLAQVDALIAKQEILLEKLAEQRIALISHVVTKGLNPDVEMKESGIEWLGKIPSHWDILALHYVVRLISGSTITALDFVESASYPVYGGNGLRGYIDRYTHDGDYILIGRQGALCGNINFAIGKFFATEHAMVVNPLINLNYKWLGFLLIAMNLNQYSTTAAQPGISGDVIGRLKILLPNIREQTKIAEYIESALLDIEHLANKVVLLKTKLKEYRSTLITQVVTGKIDVRDISVN